MRARSPLPFLAVVLLAIPLTASAQGTSRGKGGGRSAHPAVSGAEACEQCHADATPGPFREWRDGAHGLNLVKCFVCHGSTGADFRLKPVAGRCTGCHAEQVASMRGPTMKGKDCFTCHSPHALDPHATTSGSSAAAALGADRLQPMVTVEGRIPPPAPAVQPVSAPSSAAAPTGPGTDKDATQSKPHPPTDR
jgi:hypothetical protein